MEAFAPEDVLLGAVQQTCAATRTSFDVCDKDGEMSEFITLCYDEINANCFSVSN